MRLRRLVGVGLCCCCWVSGGLEAKEGKAMNAQPHDAQSSNQPFCDLPMSDEELKKRLTPEQYRIVRLNGTEAPFANAYWNNHRPGLYVDVVTGEPLFASVDKFDSQTGWPSFTKPLEQHSLLEREDASAGMVRTEVRAKRSGAHLGHVFPDGPRPTGLRYCINSAALRFIPAEDLEKAGYGAYRRLFDQASPH